MGHLGHHGPATDWEYLQERRRHTERGEEPPVLAADVALLQDLLDALLRLLALGDFLEGIGRDDALEALELEGVACGHQVVVVYRLDEGLDLGSLVLARLGHALCDLLGVPLDAGHQGVAVGVQLVAGVGNLNDHDLQKCANPVSESSLESRPCCE